MNHYPLADWPESRSFFSVLKGVFFHGKEELPSSAKNPDLATQTESDAEIEQDIRDELRAEPSIRGAAIDVRFKDVVATLTGTIDGDGEQWLIEVAARRIAGVNDVSMMTNIIVPEPGMRTDADIALDCEDMLATLTPTGDYAVKAMVSSGRVTLQGSVASGYERGIAERAVSGLRDVSGVNGQIKVRHAVRLGNSRSNSFFTTA